MTGGGKQHATYTSSGADLDSAPSSFEEDAGGDASSVRTTADGALLSGVVYGPVVLTAVALLGLFRLLYVQRH